MKTLSLDLIVNKDRMIIVKLKVLENLNNNLIIT